MVDEAEKAERKAARKDRRRAEILRSLTDLDGFVRGIRIKRCLELAAQWAVVVAYFAFWLHFALRFEPQARTGALWWGMWGGGALLVVFTLPLFRWAWYPDFTEEEREHIGTILTDLEAGRMDADDASKQLPCDFPYFKTFLNVFSCAPRGFLLGIGIIEAAKDEWRAVDRFFLGWFGWWSCACAVAVCVAFFWGIWFYAGGEVMAFFALIAAIVIGGAILDFHLEVRKVSTTKPQEPLEPRR